MPEQETSISELGGMGVGRQARRQVPDLIVFTEAQDLVVGFAAPGYPCDDVRCAQPRITSNYTGWNRFARDDMIDTLACLWNLFQGANWACEFAENAQRQQ